MQKDSLESLLSRHYGSTAPAPAALEERLLASVRFQAVESRREQLAKAHLYQKRVSRRNAFKLFARGTARVGLDALGAGLDGLQVLEVALEAH
jgi:hypothetical protein